MNIFFIDPDPVQSAKWMVDRHVVKMILESAQLLSTAHRVLDGELVVETVKTEYPGNKPAKYRKKKWYKLGDARETVLYSATHVNHPSAVWARTSIENYHWLVDHFFALMEEYTYRYEKTHKCFGELSYMLQSPPKKLEAYDWTPMPSCMDEQYIISDDPVQNYRNYYKYGKVHLHKWKNREKPFWMTNETA